MNPQNIWKTLSLLDEIDFDSEGDKETQVRQFSIQKATEQKCSGFEIMLKLMEAIGWWELGWRVVENCDSLTVGSTLHSDLGITSPVRAIVVEVINLNGGQLIRLGHPDG